MRVSRAVSAARGSHPDFLGSLRNRLFSPELFTDPETTNGWVRRTTFAASPQRFLMHCGLGLAWALAAFAAASVIAVLHPLMNLLFLVVVAAVALRGGFWQATCVAVACVLLQSSRFESGRWLPAHWHRGLVIQAALTLLILETAAFALSQIALRMEALAAEGDHARRRTQRLHSMSHEVLLLNPQDAPERQIAEFIAREFDLEAVAVADDQGNSLGVAGRWLGRESTVHAWLSGEKDSMPTGISRRTLYSGTGQSGTLLVAGDIPAYVLDSLASLVVLALDRHRSYVSEGAAEAARHTEELRTTVLDALAHAIKTPLTIIRAASSGMLESGMRQSGMLESGMPETDRLSATQHHLVSMIDQQSEVIENLTTRLLQTARVDSEALSLHLQTIRIDELIREVLDEFLMAGEATAGDAAVGAAALPPAVRAVVDPAVQPIQADHEMLTTVLRELLTNAVKYSHSGSPITISAEDFPLELRLAVQSFGPVIVEQDRERIFEKFFRSAAQRDAIPGTGLGLSIALRVAEAHGGDLWVTSTETSGTTFYLSLPRSTEWMQPETRAAKETR